MLFKTTSPTFGASPQHSRRDLWETCITGIGPGQLTRSMVLAGANKVMTVENGDTYQSSLQVPLDNLLFWVLMGRNRDDTGSLVLIRDV